eukprot:1835581-Alexandrium_andersonii.AAC.1
MALTLVLSPWVQLVKEIHPDIAPRMLADDMALVTGPSEDLQLEELHQVHTQAIACTLEYLNDLGARVSAPKCISASNSGSLRGLMKRQQYNEQGLRIPVKCDLRDLGAHLNCAARA